MEKLIYGKYKIVDCEHQGDIDSARHDLEKLNVDIVDTYWDGHDCGEAYHEFLFPESQFERIYKALGSSATYEANIYDYIKPDFSWAKGINFPIMDERKYKETLYPLTKDVSPGFEQRIPYCIHFDVEPGVKPAELIKEFLRIFPHPRKVTKVAATLMEEYGQKRYEFLVTAPYKDVDGIWNEKVHFFLDRKLFGNSVIHHRLYMGRGHDFKQQVEWQIAANKPIAQSETTESSRTRRGRGR